MPSPADNTRTLEDLRQAWADKRHPQRDRYSFVSALNSLARHSGKSLANLPLDVDRMQNVAKAVNPHVVGVTPSHWVSVRSRCKTAIELYRNDFKPLPEKMPLSPKWLELWNRLDTKFDKNTLSSLVHAANAQGVEPLDVDNRFVEQFEQTRPEGRYRDLEKYRRARRKLWNVVGERHPELTLQRVTVPAINYRRTRIPYRTLPQSLRGQIDAYLHWCSSANPFLKDARKRILKRPTLIHQQNYLHAAADALVASGFSLNSIFSVSVLLEPDHLRAICFARLQKADYRHTAHNAEIGRTLVQVATWLGMDRERFAEIRDIVSAQLRPPNKMTEKNTQTVAFYHRDQIREGLLRLPQLLFAEARLDGNKRLRLAKLQAGLAIGIETYIPIRLANLVALRFGEPLELADGLATLRVPRDQVKNIQPLEFDIPPHLVALLREYRDTLCPLLTGRPCEHLFVNLNNKRKRPPAVRHLVKEFSKRYLGRQINPHAFRHLAAKTVLDASPGAYPLVQDLLGHTSMMTAKDFYSEPDTKRAARYHRDLLLKHVDLEDRDDEDLGEE